MWFRTLKDGLLKEIESFRDDLLRRLWSNHSRAYEPPQCNHPKSTSITANISTSMASTLRVALRRQARLPLSAQKAFTNQSIFTNPSPALQILNSWSPPALPSKWKNPTRTTSISSLRIAAFHVTTRRSILPPGPRMYSFISCFILPH